MSRKVQLRVEFDLPEGATVRDAKEYVLDAVASMKGALRPAGALGEDDPGDPMFYLDGDSVTIFEIRKPRK